MKKQNRKKAPSGRFVLRIDASLHAALRQAATSAGLSLNEYCVRKLTVPGNVDGPASAVIERAASAAGASLVAVVVFGSWARGRLAASSDVDLLIVVDRDVTIARRLYRDWDRAPLDWEGHPAEPHFVHLPEPGTSPGSLWAEVAVDGIVLFERDFVVSRALAEIRQRIASGRLVRRTIHGQAYWVEAA